MNMVLLHRTRRVATCTGIGAVDESGDAWRDANWRRIRIERTFYYIKLAFHGADTDSDTDTDILADLSDTRDFPREDPCEDVR